MSELVAAYQRTSALFTGACRVPSSGVAVSLEFRRVAKWRISPVFVARRIYDVKSKNRPSWRASAIPSRIQLSGEDFGSESTRLMLIKQRQHLSFFVRSGKRKFSVALSSSIASISETPSERASSSSLPRTPEITYATWPLNVECASY